MDSKEPSRKPKYCQKVLFLDSFTVEMTGTTVKCRERKDHTRNAMAISWSFGLVTCSKKEMDGTSSEA